MIDLNDVVRVVADWDGPNGAYSQLVWHYLVTAGNNEDPADVLDDIVTNFEAAWANIASVVSDAWASGSISLLQRDTSLHQWDGVAQTTSANLDGGSASDGIPPGAAALVKIFTQSARRQARKYVMGILEGSVTNGLLLASPMVALGLFVADLVDDVTSGTETLVMGTYNTIPTSVLYESFSENDDRAAVEAVIAYPRRRRPGTGV